MAYSLPRDPLAQQTYRVEVKAARLQEALIPRVECSSKGQWNRTALQTTSLLHQSKKKSLLTRGRRRGGHKSISIHFWRLLRDQLLPIWPYFALFVLEQKSWHQSGALGESRQLGTFATFSSHNSCTSPNEGYFGHKRVLSVNQPGH